MTTELEGGEWSAARPGHTLPPEKTQYSSYRRLGGPQRWPGRAKNLVPTGIRSRTIQSIVSSYTDWATWPKDLCHMGQKNVKKDIWTNGRASSRVIRANEELGELYWDLDTVADIKKEEIGMDWTFSKKGSRKGGWENIWE